MTTRRTFLYQTAIATTALATNPLPLFSVNRKVRARRRLELTFEPYELQLRHVFTVASYSRSSTPDIQVRIDYDGFTGYGEASMPPYLSAELGTTESVMDFLGRAATLLREFDDPFRMDEILTAIDRMDHGNAAGKAAIDIALHDLVGRIMEQPWYRIWGLSPEDAPSTTFTRDNDREMIETIRSVTQLPIAVDANQGWKDKQKALDMILWLHEQGVVMVEQPMPKTQLDDIAWVSEHSPLPIFADESIQRLADVRHVMGAFTGINIKLMKCTGMREAWKMVNTARALGMKVMVGCMTETSCGISAAAQFSPAVDFADLDGNLLISNDRFKGVQVKKGKLVLPTTPGIGIEKI